MDGASAVWRTEAEGEGRLALVSEAVDLQMLSGSSV